MSDRTKLTLMVNNGALTTRMLRQPARRVNWRLLIVLALILIAFLIGVAL